MAQFFLSSVFFFFFYYYDVSPAPFTGVFIVRFDHIRPTIKINFPQANIYIDSIIQERLFKAYFPAFGLFFPFYSTPIHYYPAGSLFPSGHLPPNHSTVCARRSDPFYMITYYTKLVSTSWT